jgi:lipopolysaccharide transport system ATP-binding protein
MGEVAREGRTVLFVSHNMGAVSSLCSRGIVLKKGAVVFDGTAAKAVETYTCDASHNADSHWEGEAGDENVTLHRTWAKPLGRQDVFDTAADMEIGLELTIKRPINGLILGFTLWSQFGYELAYCLADDSEAGPPEQVQPGTLTKRFRIPRNTLASGTYRVEFDIGIHMLKRIIQSEGEVSFTLENATGIGRRYTLNQMRGRNSLFRPDWASRSSQE